LLSICSALSALKVSGELGSFGGLLGPSGEF
jgi:hypothetical protein